MSPVSRLLYPVFCLLSPASCLMSPESNILSHFSHLMSQVSNLLSQVSCLLSPISYLLSPVSRLLSQGSCLKYPFSCLMCPALCPTMLNCFKQKQITCTRNAISRIYIRFPFKIWFRNGVTLQHFIFMPLPIHNFFYLRATATWASFFSSRQWR